MKMNDTLRRFLRHKLGVVSLVVVAVIVLLIVSALADLLVLCFEVNRWFGYAMSAIMLVLVCIFISYLILQLMPVQGRMLEFIRPPQKL